MPRVRLDREEIVARVELLLTHAPRSPLRRLANFAHLSAREFQHLLAGDVELAELVRAAPLAVRSPARLDFDAKLRVQRALLAIDRLGGPGSGWVDSMHEDFLPCQ